MAMGADEAEGKLGQTYDALADWWREMHRESKYGMRQLSRALDFASKRGDALDVGCGSRLTNGDRSRKLRGFV